MHFTWKTKYGPKAYHHSWKITIIFTSVLGSQSAAGTSLALFSAMNEWQRVLFLNRELSRLFRVG